MRNVQAASKNVAHLTPEEAATDEDYWATIQNSFSVTRGIINLNNGGVSPSPRIVTEALVRYIWEQEDATAYTMWQILEPQSETIRTGLAELFGCDREEIAITRNASESLETLLMGMDFKSGDEILTTTQDYPRMLTTLRQREKRENLKLKLIQIPIPPKNLSEITAAFEKGITDRTRIILISHMINITGQITPVKAVCDIARARGIETIVDGAHSFAQFNFKQKDVGCDYFGTSLHKWLYAPKGTGMLYVKRDKIEKLWPLMAAEAKQASDIRKFEEIGTHKSWDLLARGILRMEDVPADVDLTDTQLRQVACHRTGSAHVDRAAIRQFLSRLEYPLHFLDFETVQSAVPLFDRSRPFMAIPFQFSLHIVRTKGGSVEHHSFLAKGSSDPRPALLSELRRLLGEGGSIIGYNTAFEMSRLADCASYFPECADWVSSLSVRFVDLLEVFRAMWYYHPSQNGSASLKDVLPALTGTSYEGLEIDEGDLASREFMRITFSRVSRRERRRVRRALERYCAQDTRGLIDILAALEGLAVEATPSVANR